MNAISCLGCSPCGLSWPPCSDCIDNNSPTTIRLTLQGTPTNKTGCPACTSYANASFDVPRIGDCIYLLEDIVICGITFDLRVTLLTGGPQLITAGLYDPSGGGALASWAWFTTDSRPFDCLSSKTLTYTNSVFGHPCNYPDFLYESV